MILKIEIENGIFNNILLLSNSKEGYIHLSNIQDNEKLSISNENIYSLITSLHIIYREKFNVDYPNKSE